MLLEKNFDTGVASYTEKSLPPSALLSAQPRPHIGGKFIFVGDTKFYVKGVSYGAFRPDEARREYHDLEQIERDFAQMAAHGINTVRIPHTMPPRALLDIAERHGLRVMVGLSAEQYVGYLIDKNRAPNIDKMMREKVRTVAGHPALLCYGIGNEIPASVARWIGKRRIERYLHRIYRIVKQEDPHGLVTYVNYPSTEYLQLPFLDFVCFNVYLETENTLRSYLARLQNIANDRPLLMSEIGLDAFRNGETKQAQSVEWQIRTTFAAGCAGAIIFSWTDEWFRGGAEVDDWAFGLTDRDRRPKPVLYRVQRAFDEVPFDPCRSRPRVSVVVCSYNGARTIRECLEGLRRLEYRNYEVIVVNDGSTDATPDIAREYDVLLINTDQNGLSHARNVGWRAATGDLVAYIDDDAYPDPHWLDYLVAWFERTDHVGIGGPNIPPATDGFIADCVAHSPGGPVHVLLTDEIAEHIPGCNMAFRKSALAAIGGFDPQFHAAGDDVDVCWRLQARGWTLGFCPPAVVWHHRRNSVSAYWRQQKGYGKAEALLETKWPEKYNSAGHHTFEGRLYGKTFSHILGSQSRIYHGLWGSAPFQRLYEPSTKTLRALPIMPEWYLAIFGLFALAITALSWKPLLGILPLAIAVTLTLLQVGKSAALASRSTPHPSFVTRMRRSIMIGFLHMLQPVARLSGRVKYGLTFWRRRGVPGFAFPRIRTFAFWTRKWMAPENRLGRVERWLREHRSIFFNGHDFARWDLEIRSGAFAAARVLMAVEDQGSGTQYVRFRVWPTIRPVAIASVGLFAALTTVAGLDAAWVMCAVLGAGLIWFLLCTWQQAGSAMAAALRAIEPQRMEAD
jgi:O-antigen biosynthesis protein